MPLHRGLSDHLGDFEGYHDFVNWNVIEVYGWGNFVLKEKFKILKKKKSSWVA
jgi:hypothetical protein